MGLLSSAIANKTQHRSEISTLCGKYCPKGFNGTAISLVYTGEQVVDFEPFTTDQILVIENKHLIFPIEEVRRFETGAPIGRASGETPPQTPPLSASKEESYQAIIGMLALQLAEQSEFQRPDGSANISAIAKRLDEVQSLPNFGRESLRKYLSQGISALKEIT